MLIITIKIELDQDISKSIQAFSIHAM